MLAGSSETRVRYLFIILFLLAHAQIFGQSNAEENFKERIRKRLESIQLQDHLEPEQGLFTSLEFTLEYHRQVRSILLDSLGDYPIARMIVLPSFSTEYVISVDNEEGRFFVTRIDLDKSIWYSQTPECIIPTFKSKEISSDLAESFSILYQKALLQTKYAERSIIGCDGVYYHFSARVHFGVLSATKWSPSEGTKIEELVRITETLLGEFQEEDMLLEIHTLIERFQVY